MEFYAELTVFGAWYLFVDNGQGVRTQLIGPRGSLDEILKAATATGSPLRVPLIPGPMPPVGLTTQIPSAG